MSIRTPGTGTAVRNRGRCQTTYGNAFVIGICSDQYFRHRPCSNHADIPVSMRTDHLPPVPGRCVVRVGRPGRVRQPARVRLASEELLVTGAASCRAVVPAVDELVLSSCRAKLQ